MAHRPDLRHAIDGGLDRCARAGYPAGTTCAISGDQASDLIHLARAALSTLAVLLSITLASGCAEAQKPSQPAAVGDAAGKIDVHFSPHGGCQDAVVHEIDAAQKSIRVQAYSFTNAKIAEALLRAKKRGVDVEVILGHYAGSQQAVNCPFPSGLALLPEANSRSARLGQVTWVTDHRPHLCEIGFYAGERLDVEPQRPCDIVSIDPSYSSHLPVEVLDAEAGVREPLCPSG